MSGLLEEQEAIVFLLQEMQQLHVRQHDEIRALTQRQNELEEEIEDRLDDFEIERHDMIVKSMTALKRDIKNLQEERFSLLDDDSFDDEEALAVATRAAAGFGMSRSITSNREAAMSMRGTSTAFGLSTRGGVGGAAATTTSMRPKRASVLMSSFPQNATTEEILEAEAPDEEDDSKLPEDIYSFFATTKYFLRGRPRLAFSITVFVFFVQILTLALFSIDVIDLDNRFNPLGIPPGVENTVRFSQVIALLITAASQDETQLSLNVLSRGYDKTAVAKFRGKVTDFKWYFSILTRFLIGALSLAVTFMLIIRSDTVRDLMLDFTAVSFVSQIDDGTYILSKWGYLGKVVRAEAEEIATIPILVNNKTPGSELGCCSSSRRTIPRFLSLALMLFGHIVAWMILTARQIDGKFVPQLIYVQFDDDFSFPMGTFSGLYELEVGNFWEGGRDMKYVGVRQVPDSRFDARFAYCVDERAWVFQIGEDPVTGEDLTNENCKNSYIAKSAQAVTFDIAETNEGHWFYRERVSKQDFPLKQFVIQGQETYVGKGCQKDADCGTSGLYFCALPDEEDDQTTNTASYCACRNQRYGLNCEFETPCKELEIDAQLSQAGFVGTRPWSLEWYYIPMPDGTPYSVYHKPIFIGAEERVDGFDVMLFAGRRWLMTNTNFMPNVPKDQLSPEGVALFLSETFHAYWADYEYAFVSSEVDAGTPTASATPVEKEWRRIESLGANGALITRDSSALLLCASCHDTINPCFFNNTCHQDTQRCVCETGSTGTLCQIPPVGDGMCNPFFNQPDFAYDGGDCCQATCLSSDTVDCGEDIVITWAGLTTKRYTGYESCADLRELCHPDTPDCWKTAYSNVGERAFSEFGLTVALAPNGAVWALVESDTVIVLEQHGRSSRQRGEPFFKTNIKSVAFSLDGDTLAIGTVSTSVETYVWKERASTWKLTGQVDNADDRLSSVSLNAGGTILAVGFQTGERLKEGTFGRVSIYQYNHGLFEWEKLGNDITDDGIGRDRQVSLAYDGASIAVGLYTSNSTLLAELEERSNRNSELPAHRKLSGGFKPDSVAVYSFDGNDWAQRGQMLGVSDFYTMNSERFGRWVSLSGSGDRVAVTSTVERNQAKDRLVSVHDYDETTGMWTQVGGVLEDNPLVGSDTGPSLALSYDGKVVASTSLRQEEVVRAYLSVYELNGSDWVVIGETVPIGESPLSVVPAVAISGDGAMVAVGHEKRFGDVLVYRNPMRSIALPGSGGFGEASTTLVALNFSFTLDIFPEHTGLFLECQGIPTAGSLNAGDYFVPDESGTAVVYVDRDAICEFAITDSQGDGICCSQGDGKYEIFFGERVEENLIARGGGVTFGSIERLFFVATEPTDLIPLTVQISYSQMYEFAQELGMSLLCGNSIESRAPVGGLAGELGNQFILDGVLTKTFLVQAGVQCEFEIFKKKSVDNGNGYLCESCALAYEIFQGNASDPPSERNVYVKQGLSEWAMTPHDTAKFTVTTEPVNLVPITIVINPDLGSSETGFSMSCANSLEVGFDVGFDVGYLTPNNTTLPASFVYRETFYAPFGSLCTVTVIDQNGLCCGNGVGSYQVYSSDNLVDENLIIQGDRFGGSDTVVFTAAPVDPEASVLRVVIQTDRRPEETEFSLKCDGELDLVIGLVDYPIVSDDKPSFNFLVKNVETCTFMMTDSGGNGINRGYYEIYNGTEPLLYVSSFNGISMSHDLSLPPLIVTVNALVDLSSVKGVDVSYEMRCASFIETGTVASETKTMTFAVLEGVPCQFSLLGSTGTGLCDRRNLVCGSFQLYFGEDLNPSSLIAEGGSSTDLEIVLFQASPPVNDDGSDENNLITLGVSYPIPPDLSWDPTFALECGTNADIFVDFSELSLTSNQVISQIFVVPQLDECQLQHVDCCDDLFELSFNSVVFNIVERGAIVESRYHDTLLPPFTREAFVPLTILLQGEEFEGVSFRADSLSYNFSPLDVVAGGEDTLTQIGNESFVGVFIVEDGSPVTISGLNMSNVSLSVYYGSYYEDDEIFQDKNLAAALWNQTHGAALVLSDSKALTTTTENSLEVVVDYDFDDFPEESSSELVCSNGYRLNHDMKSVTDSSSTSLAHQPFRLSYSGISNMTDCSLYVFDEYGDGMKTGGFTVRLPEDDLIADYHDQGDYRTVAFNISTASPPSLVYFSTSY